MKESLLSVGGIAPPTTSPKPNARKASTTKTGLKFDAFLRDEVQPKQPSGVGPTKEEPKPEICAKPNPDNASQSTKIDKPVEAAPCIPPVVNPQQTPTAKDPAKSGSQAAQTTQITVQPVLAAPIKGDAENIMNLSLAGDLAAAAKDTVIPNILGSASQEAAAPQTQQSTGKEILPSSSQLMPDQSGKTQFQSQLTTSLDKASPDLQATGESHLTAKTAANPTSVAAAGNNPAPDISVQMSVQSSQKPSEDHSPQVTANNPAPGNPRKDGLETAAAKPDNPPPVSSGLEKTGLTETHKAVEPARLAEARAPELMSQILDGLETLVKNKNVMMRLQLYPDELGHIELKVVSSAQGLGVYLRADQATTQQLLESQLTLLRQTLTSAGINPAQIDVGQNTTNRSFNTRDPRGSANKLFKDANRGGTGSTNAIEIPILGRNFSENGLDYKI